MNTVAVRIAAAHVRGRPGRTLAGLATFGLVLAALATPYVAFQHAHTGSWALTSKSQDASIEAWRSVAEGDRRARDEVLYAIDDTGTGLGSETRSLTTLAREDPAGWLGIVATNAATIGRWYLLAQLLPLFLLLPALRQLWVTRHRRTTRVLAAVAATPLVTCLAFFTLPRYLLLTTAILIPFGAWGLVDLLAGRSPLVRRRWWTTIGVLAGISLLVGAYPLLPSSPAAERTDPQAIGEWLAANTPDDARVMTRSFHVQAYAEREVVALPYAEWDEVDAFARRMGVTHLIADELTILRRRPELADALLGDEPPDGLTLVHELTSRGRTTRIFAFTPAPEPSDEPPIYLGYVSD